MAPASLLDLVSALPSNDSWGPPVSNETMLDGVPYAPYSKADKLGRMADWTDGKDRDRGGRQNYGGRNYRGEFYHNKTLPHFRIQDASNLDIQISKSMAQTSRRTHSPSKQQKRRLHSPL